MSVMPERSHSSDLGAPRLPAIVRQGKAEAPVTHWQKDWLAWIARGGTAFTVPHVFACFGELQLEPLRRSLSLLLERHENLRTCYRYDDLENASQFVLPETEIELAEVDLTRQEDEVTSDYVRQVVTHHFEMPFDLRKDPPLRAFLFKIASDRHLLLLALSHIATDSYSGSLIVRELISSYEALCRGVNPALQRPQIQFNDYAWWTHELYASGVLEDSVACWKSHLQGATPIALPVEPPDAADVKKGNVMGWQPMGAIPTIGPSLQQIAKQARTTPVNVLKAALRVVLAQWTGQPELFTASVTHGRPKPVLHKLTGLFRGFVGMRVDLSGDPTFLDLVRRVHDADLRACAHELGFQVAHAKGLVTLPPLAEHFFVDHMSGVLRSWNEASSREGTLNLIPFAFELRGERTMPEQMTIRTHVHGHSVQAGCSYAKNLFAAEEIELVMRRYAEAIAFFAARPETRISRFGTQLA